MSYVFGPKCMFVCFPPHLQAVTSPSKRSRKPASTKGYLSRVLSPQVHNVYIPRMLCGSGIISFYQRFKTTLMNGTKTETRRGWSDRTAHTKSFLDRMQFAFEQGLFLRATCGTDSKKWPVVIGWIRINSMLKEKLGDMTVEDVVREGYPGKTVEWFLEKEFSGTPKSTMVWVVKFSLLPVV